MFQLPNITQDERLECSLHHKPLEKITWKCKQSNIVAKFLCEECPLEDPNKTRKFEYRTYADEKTYSITFLDLPPVPSNANNTKTEQKETPPIDFRYCQVEHIIIDEKAYGYTYKSLVYISDKQMLIACNPNGTLSVWSVAGSLNFIGRFNVGKPITWGEYIDRGNKGKHLVLGIQNEIYVYNIEGGIPIFLTILKCEGIVSAIDFISPKDQIVSVGYDSFVSVWNLGDWSLDRTINTKSSKKLPLMSVVYIEKKNILAVQDNKGVYFLPFEKKKTGISQSYKVEPDHIYGLAYLPQHQEFILRSPRGIHILDEHLSLKIKYVTFMNSSNISNSRFLINEDETQILSSTPSDRMTVSQRDGSYLIFPLTGMIKEGPVLELMRDQQRFILADNTSGRMFILRTNVPKETGFVLQGSFFEKTDFKAENTESIDIVKEEPMVLENVKDSKDFFTNNETRATIFEEEQKQGMKIEAERRVKANRSKGRKRSKDKETSKEGSLTKNQSKKKTIGKGAKDKNEDRLTKDRDKSRSKERKGKKTTKHG